MTKLVAAAVSILFLTVSPVSAMSERDCAAAWDAADENKDGFLTADEGARYHAAVGMGDKSLIDGKLPQSAFMAHCKAGLFDQGQSSAGAPFKGANSFTEGEARNRGLSRGYRNVSPLTMNADGIWRGTAELNGVKVDVTVDYKGNVTSLYP